MKEKFYCVGCKQHYELSVHAAQRQPSKGGSFRHSLISECPKGHRVNKLCKKEVYETYNEADAETFEATTGYGYDDPPERMTDEEGWLEMYDAYLEYEDEPQGMTLEEYKKWIIEAREEDYQMQVKYEQRLKDEGRDMDGNPIKGAEEEGSAPVQDPMEFGEMANWTPLDGTPSLRKRKRAEGMTVGVGLEALEPTPDEPESGESMVPADSLMPEGSGHVIGSQSTSHNFTPFHAEGEKYPCDSCNKMVSRSDLKVMMGSYDEDYQVCQDCLTYDAETEVHDVETFIVYPELYEYLMMQDLLPSNKTSTKHLQDDDYEVTVPAYLLDEILAAVSEYQSTEIAEKSDSDFAFGKSKTTVAVAAAGVALMGAWLWNKRK